MTSTQLPDEATTPPSTRMRVGLVAVVVVGVAALLFGGGALTNAFFTSQATVHGSAATATVEIQADTASASSPIAVTDMLPGDSASTTIELENTGTESVYYTVRIVPTAAGDVLLEDELEVTVQAGAASLTRTLTAWRSGALQIGPALAAGVSDDVTVTLTLPLGAADAVQGMSAGFAVQFDAIQQRNVPVPTAGWVAD